MGRHPLYWFGATAAFAVLMLGVWLYSRPDLAIMLAEQLWACF